MRNLVASIWITQPGGDSRLGTVGLRGVDKKDALRGSRSDWSSEHPQGQRDGDVRKHLPGQSNDCLDATSADEFSPDPALLAPTEDRASGSKDEPATVFGEVGDHVLEPSRVS
ncbi:hypothetical protein BN10_880011 [Phycicoccus elongatus Lp2]|uniref:Uncharacterized protein n=1 Tax=Phycicoccus elongatus Lp2 TaxID=1193181 RepID=N0E5E6_9MICO|nr:hypothetical protein BN10_880011 [Phycicoccus elongatus Lp2]